MKLCLSLRWSLYPSVSRKRQMKYTLCISCQCFHGAFGRQLRREASEGPRQSVHVQIPLHWLKKKNQLWPPVIHTDTHTYYFPSCSLALRDFLLVSLKWVSSGVKHTHIYSTCTHVHTLACRHNEGFRHAFAKALAQSCPFGMAWIMDKCALGAIK